MTAALDEPLRTEVGGIHGADDFFLRTSYHQFRFSEPGYSDVARLLPMFDRDFPAPKYSFLSADVIAEVLGCSFRAFMDSSIFFGAAAMSNAGLFNPQWLQGEIFGELRDVLDSMEVVAAFHSFWASTFKQARTVALKHRSKDPLIRQYDFSPLIARPFLQLTTGDYVAPNVWHVHKRISATALYFLGLDHFKTPEDQSSWTRELGYVNEEYVLAQLKQLEPAASVLGEITYRTKDGDAKSVDAFVRFADLMLLIESKSVRPTMSSRLGITQQRAHLSTRMDDAFRKQIPRSAALVESGGVPTLEIPHGMPIKALVVTPEQIYGVNNREYRALLPDPAVPTVVVSFRELENLVAASMSEGGASRVFHEAIQEDANGNSDPRRPLYGLRDAASYNPLLDDAFRASTWPRIIEAASSS